jgi:hypothetical protein
MIRGVNAATRYIKVNFCSESLPMFSLNLTPRTLRKVHHETRSIAAKLLDNVRHDLLGVVRSQKFFI